jgi:hypothetical protein
VVQYTIEHENGITEYPSPDNPKATELPKGLIEKGKVFDISWNVAIFLAQAAVQIVTGALPGVRALTRL